MQRVSDELVKGVADGGYRLHEVRSVRDLALDLRDCRKALRALDKMLADAGYQDISDEREAIAGALGEDK